LLHSARRAAGGADAPLGACRSPRGGGYSPSFGLAAYFLHDLAPEVVKRGEAQERPEAEVAFGEPCRFEAWPAIPSHVIAGRDDRFFPIEFQRRVAPERLHVPNDELPGGISSRSRTRAVSPINSFGYVRDG
jgi:hypothetical protein